MHLKMSSTKLWPFCKGSDESGDIPCTHHVHARALQSVTFLITISTDILRVSLALGKSKTIRNVWPVSAITGRQVSFTLSLRTLLSGNKLVSNVRSNTSFIARYLEANTRASETCITLTSHENYGVSNHQQVCGLFNSFYACHKEHQILYNYIIVREINRLLSISRTLCEKCTTNRCISFTKGQQCYGVITWVIATMLQL